jgi:SPP1 family predicted phage head-tail adaptor
MKPSTATDATWGAKETYPDPAGTVDGVNIIKAWAKVSPVKGTEKTGEDGVKSATSFAILTRFIPSITSAWRISFRGRLLDIVGVVNVDERSNELEIEAVEHGQQS